MTEKLTTMAVTAALVFAGQMINDTIPGTGAAGRSSADTTISAPAGKSAWRPSPP